MGDTLILLDLLERILGKGERKSRGNYAFTCPNCQHVKKKLEINLDLKYWECWVCGARDGFKGKKITTLLKKLKKEEFLNELYVILPEERGSGNYKPKSTTVNPVIALPKEFTSLFEPKNSLEKIKSKQALAFLKSRNVLNEDIVKYNIGICHGGDYLDRVIIPSYDSEANLNYFVTRDYTGNAFQKYKNPPVSSDIIGFELFINWDIPVILCEGVFDALAIKRNVVPLFGKVIHQNLMKKLVGSKVTKIYISLDSDAQKDSLKYAEELLGYGKKVFLVNIKDGKDASELGFKAYLDVLSQTYALTYSDIIEYKLK